MGPTLSRLKRAIVIPSDLMKGSNIEQNDDGTFLGLVDEPKVGSEPCLCRHNFNKVCFLMASSAA